MTTDDQIHDSITAAIDEERRLRGQLASGQITTQSEHERIAELEIRLDRLWDLLRRRQADREFHADPAREQMRPAAVVEDYLD
ncbi:DUF2630 family protein [Propioniciclava flava]|uniref:DUF2630 domain-containing protein n=1 Tax=Propioniciclava flava TaxID=2072026 RepID=A0A4Q2EJ08_9ACTN|nr:DUF2630 family protein [Propioniciclava flava]RXW32424.1 DUF2630 domain-containing protein [Propioniciclava flava]